MVQKSFSPKEKKKKFWTNAAWPFLQRIKGMFEWLFLFLHVAQRGAGSFSNQCPSLPFLEGEKMGLDARHFHPVDADRRAESCSCCYIHHLLNVFSFSIAPAAPRTLWENLAQRLSWQPQRGVRHYQGAQIFFLSATWGFKMLSISCNKFPRLPSPILRLPMSVIYAYAGVEYIHSHAMLFFLLFSNDDWKTPTEA